MGFNKPYQDAWFFRDYVRGALKTGLSVERQSSNKPNSDPIPGFRFDCGYKSKCNCVKLESAEKRETE